MLQCKAVGRGECMEYWSRTDHQNTSTKTRDLTCSIGSNNSREGAERTDSMVSTIRLKVLHLEAIDSAHGARASPRRRAGTVVSFLARIRQGSAKTGFFGASPCCVGEQACRKGTKMSRVSAASPAGGSSGRGKSGKSGTAVQSLSLRVQLSAAEARIADLERQLRRNKTGWAPHHDIQVPTG